MRRLRWETEPILLKNLPSAVVYNVMGSKNFLLLPFVDVATNSCGWSMWTPKGPCNVYCDWSGSTSKLEEVKVLQDWPAQSPDRNVIQHVWGTMIAKAWRMKLRSRHEIWKSSKTAFVANSDNFITKFFESLRRHLDAVFPAHGRHMQC